jgi:hypothetical protein
MLILPDDRILELINEAKSLPSGLCPLDKMSQRNLHKRKDFDLTCLSGNKFLVAVRQSCLNPFDFSVILGYYLPQSYTVFRLRRYNGKSHTHCNHLERETPFYDFHIHTATERYQRRGFREEHFAEITNRYWSLESAIKCLLMDCGFPSPLADLPMFSGKI